MTFEQFWAMIIKEDLMHEVEKVFSIVEKELKRKGCEPQRSKSPHQAKEIVRKPFDPKANGINMRGINDDKKSYLTPNYRRLLDKMQS